MARLVSTITANEVFTVVPLVSVTLKSTIPTPSELVAGGTITVRFVPEPPNETLASSAPLAGSTAALTTRVEGDCDWSPMVKGTVTGGLTNGLGFGGVGGVGGKICGSTVTLKVPCATSPFSSVTVTSTVLLVTKVTVPAVTKIC